MKLKDIIKFETDLGYLTNIILFNKYEIDLKNYYIVTNWDIYKKIKIHKDYICLSSLLISREYNCYFLITDSGIRDINSEIDVMNEKRKNKIPHLQYEKIKSKIFHKFIKRMELINE